LSQTSDHLIFARGWQSSWSGNIESSPLSDQYFFNIPVFKKLYLKKVYLKKKYLLKKYLLKKESLKKSLFKKLYLKNSIF